jgi:hypothetical protein
LNSVAIGETFRYAGNHFRCAATRTVLGNPDQGFDDLGLRVMAASPEHVFARKVLAVRGRDEEDLRALAGVIGISTVDGAVARSFPGGELSPRSIAVLEDLSGAGVVGCPGGDCGC